MEVITEVKQKHKQLQNTGAGKQTSSRFSKLPSSKPQAHFNLSSNVQEAMVALYSKCHREETAVNESSVPSPSKL